MTTVAQLDVIITAQTAGLLSGMNQARATTSQFTKQIDDGSKGMQKFGIFAKEAGNELGAGVGRGAIQAGNALREAVVAFGATVVQIKAQTAATGALATAQAIAITSTRALSAAMAALGGPIGLAIIGTLTIIEKLHGSVEKSVQKETDALERNMKVQEKMADHIRSSAAARRGLAEDVERATRELAAFAAGGERGLQMERDRAEAFDRAREMWLKQTGAVAGTSKAIMQADAQFQAILKTTTLLVTQQRALVTAVDASKDAMKKAEDAAEEYAKKLKLVLNDPWVGSSQASAGTSFRSDLAGAIEELPPIAERARVEMKRTWGDMVHDFVSAFIDVGKGLRDGLRNVLQQVGDFFGVDLAKVFGTAFGTALGPILGTLLSSLASKIGDWVRDIGREIGDFASDISRRLFGSRGGGIDTGPGSDIQVRDTNVKDGMFGSGDADPNRKNVDKLPRGDSGNVERLNTITSRAATATIEQENRLIGIQSTALVVLRQSRDLLARLASGGVPVISRMDGDANRSRLVGGDALVPA